MGVVEHAKACLHTVACVDMCVQFQAVQKVVGVNNRIVVGFKMERCYEN